MYMYNNNILMREKCCREEGGGDHRDWISHIIYASFARHHRRHNESLGGRNANPPNKVCVFICGQRDKNASKHVHLRARVMHVLFT